ncbi:SHOCT domain-containing protein [Maribellus mangrovi]|uniref:SHOCT domain-containing protein n=1 Tax=Maribellus mangrovi TaxID=3133146 RepID=UPI0030EBAE1F
MVILILAWIVLSIVVASLGKDKKIGFGGLLVICILFSPLIGLLFAIASPNIQKYTGAVLTPEATQLYKKGIQKFNNKKYDEATELLNEALKFNPKSKTIFIGLAECYSRKQDKEKTFYYIDKAVRNGFNNFKYIQQQSSFQFIRRQYGFPEFVKNGYMKKGIHENEETTKTPESEINIKQTDKYSQLEKLAELKEKGIINEEEFQAEKAKILV